MLNELSPPTEPPETENSLSEGDRVKANRLAYQHDLSLARSPTVGQQKQPNQQSHFTKSAKCLLTKMQAINLPWVSDGQDGNPDLTEDGNAVMRKGDAAQKVSVWSSIEKGKGKGSWESFPSLY